MDDLLPLKEAAVYLGLGRVQFSRIVKHLKLPYEESPFDRRVKWFRRADLDALKGRPRLPKPLPDGRPDPFPSSP